MGHQRLSDIGVGVVIALLLLAPAFAAKPSKPDNGSNGTLVVLTAEWCATCREIIPVVQQLAGPLPVVTLDVDSSNAPEQANQYGVSVTGSDIPEVYFVKNGKTSLLFNGKGYHFGHTNQAEAQIKSRLQESQ